MSGDGKVVVTAVAGKGRGLVAAAAIAAGELIETAPAVPLNGEDCDRIEQTALGDFYFAHPDSPDHGMLVLGSVSVVNHSESPNAALAWRHADGVGWFAELRALRAIAAGEEITNRYRCPPWFPVVD